MIASLAELEARLDWELPPEEVGIAEGALADLSEDARAYGNPGWGSDTAPLIVKSLVLRAAARYMRNFEGYQQSRAGDETVIWFETEHAPDTAEFTPTERRRLEELANGRPMALTTVGSYAWQSRSGQRDVIYAHDGNKPIPWVSSEESDFYRRVM